jgi:site-specific recombinase XerD
MADVRWERYPLVDRVPQARSWLTIQANVGLAAATLDAYGRALQDYLAFCERAGTAPGRATREQISAYVRDLAERPNLRQLRAVAIEPPRGLANATMHQRLTAVRLYHQYLVEEGLRPDNPVGRGQYTEGKGFGGQRGRGLLPHFRQLPWIPSDEQWRAVLEAARTEPVRNRVMLALAYDAGLRRQELCTLRTGDVDPAARLLQLRAEVTKSRRSRVVPYSAPTAELFAAYLVHRSALTSARGPLFVSESRRNRAQPITQWTWNKVVTRLAERAGVPRFTPHTLRHLCLTDLARAGWALHEIAEFAGHRSIQTTLLYVHLSGRDLSAKLERAMASIHGARVTLAAEVLR